MASYEIRGQKVTTLGNEILGYIKSLQEYADTLKTQRNLGILSRNINIFSTRRSEMHELQTTAINQLLKEVNSEIQGMQTLGDTLISIAADYLSYEQKITNHYKGDYEINNIVFDGSGTYGGDQGSPQNNLQEQKELFDIVRSYYPGMSDKEAAYYLNKLNSEGCGYVAIINTILASYAGNEKGFEETFGFSMYNESGDLNFNKLLVDFYASTDNHSASWFGLGDDKIDFLDDYSYKEDGWLWNYSYSKDITGAGTTPSEQKYRGEMYLKDHGVDASISNDQEVTTQNYSSIIEGGGYVTINYHYGNLYNEDGTVKQYIDGGHAMIVTGVTDDGRFIVSSWGGKYYIKPDEVLKNGRDKTCMDFNVITYGSGK